MPKQLTLLYIHKLILTPSHPYTMLPGRDFPAGDYVLHFKWLPVQLLQV